MTITLLNRRQFKWTFAFVEYNFRIKYCTENINSADMSSKRFDYDVRKTSKIDH